MIRFSIIPIRREYVKGYVFLTFARNLSNKYGKKLLHTATKTGLDIEKISSKKVVLKTAEETIELEGDSITGKLVKPKPIPNEK